jgi:hypothetical protein
MIKLFNCPLLGRMVEDSECYDIQMVLNSFIKPTILNTPLDINKANLECSKCRFNQLPRNQK